MNRDDVIRMAEEAGMERCKCEPRCHLHTGGMGSLTYFAKLVAAAEREKVAQWMMQRGYATGHGDTIEDLLAELDWQIAENWNRAMINGMKTEREACAKVCDPQEDWDDPLTAYHIATAIRARGQL